jgi:altronate hydrolase
LVGFIPNTLPRPVVKHSRFTPPATPSVELATNTAMYERISEDMDINCGTILTGEESVAQCGARD